jgi:hypothetical protein
MQQMRAVFVLFVLSIVLVGCGQMPQPAPPTAPPSTAPAEAATATPGTPEAAEFTLGDLATRIGTAWSAVDSFQITSTGPVTIAPAASASPVASPLATPGATPVARTAGTFTSVRDVVLPDRQRQLVTGRGDGDYEAIAIGDGLYLRGPLTALVAPGTPPDTWVTIEQARLSPDSVLAHQLGGLPQMPSAPLASVPPRLATQPVRALGREEFDGRACQLYGAADTVTTTGTRVDYVIAIDDRDLPCFIETSTGGVVHGRDEYRQFDAAITIEAPVAATPASVPPALATPIARD